MKVRRILCVAALIFVCILILALSFLPQDEAQTAKIKLKEYDLKTGNLSDHALPELSGEAKEKEDELLALFVTDMNSKPVSVESLAELSKLLPPSRDNYDYEEVHALLGNPLYIYADGERPEDPSDLVPWYTTYTKTLHTVYLDDGGKPFEVCFHIFYTYTSYRSSSPRAVCMTLASRNVYCDLIKFAEDVYGYIQRISDGVDLRVRIIGTSGMSVVPLPDGEFYRTKE